MLPRGDYSVVAWFAAGVVMRASESPRPSLRAGQAPPLGARSTLRRRGRDGWSRACSIIEDISADNQSPMPQPPGYGWPVGLLARGWADRAGGVCEYWVRAKKKTTLLKRAVLFRIRLIQADLSGAEEARTPDLLYAIQALSQLSYSPMLSHPARGSIRSSRPCGKQPANGHPPQGAGTGPTFTDAMICYDESPSFDRPSEYPAPGVTCPAPATG